MIKSQIVDSFPGFYDKDKQWFYAEVTFRIYPKLGILYNFAVKTDNLIKKEYDGR